MRTIILIIFPIMMINCLINAFPTRHNLTPQTSIQAPRRMSLQESTSVQRKGKRKIMESSRQGVKLMNAVTFFFFIFNNLRSRRFIIHIMTFHSSTLHLSIGPPERQQVCCTKKGLREANVQR